MNLSYTRTLFLLATALLVNFASAQCDTSRVFSTDGDTLVHLCPGNGLPEFVELNHIPPVTVGEYAFVLTDTNDVVMEVIGDEAVYDFQDAGTGAWHIWGVSYDGLFSAVVGDTLSSATLAEECFEVSEGPIKVYRDVPDAGTVALEDGSTMVTVVTGNGIPDSVFFMTNSMTAMPYAYVITNEQDIILGVEMEPVHDFEGAGAGTCRVYGVSYTGTLDAPMDANVTTQALSDDCYDLSTNYITVERLAVGLGESMVVDQLSMYPSLATDNVYIQLEGRQRAGGQLVILDRTGRVVQQRSLNADGTVAVIPVNALAAGSYVCRIVTPNGIAVGRFTKQ